MAENQAVLVLVPLESTDAALLSTVCEGFKMCSDCQNIVQLVDSSKYRCSKSAERLEINFICKTRMMKSKKFNLNTESRSSCGFVMYNTPTVTTPSVPAPSSFNSNDSIPTPELPNLSQSNLLPPTAERQPSNNSRIGSHGHSRHLRFGGNSFTSTNSWLEKGQTEEEKKQFVKETLDSLRKIDLEDDCWVYY